MSYILALMLFNGTVSYEMEDLEVEREWALFWQQFDDRKRELVMNEGKTWEEADAIAREEFEASLDD